MSKKPKPIEVGYISTTPMLYKLEKGRVFLVQRHTGPRDSFDLPYDDKTDGWLFEECCDSHFGVVLVAKEVRQLAAELIAMLERRTRMTYNFPLLRRIEKEHVFSIHRYGDRFLIEECCDGVFGVTLTRDELRALASELFTLAYEDNDDQ
jgi:hypothetical protein